MPLPKDTRAALDAWKAGTGEFPGELDHGVFFPNDGAFMAEVGKKSKAREGQARDAATASFLAQLGLTDPSEIEAVKATLEQTGVLKTETERVKGDLAKAAKLLDDSRKEIETHKATNAKYAEQIKDGTKRTAVSKYYPRVRDPEVFADLVMRHLEVAEDGSIKIKGDDKKTLDQLVDETLKAKDYLKSPTFKEGTGTRPTPDPKTDPPLPFTAPEGKTLTPGQVMLNTLVEQKLIPNPQPASGGGP